DAAVVAFRREGVAQHAKHPLPGGEHLRAVDPAAHAAAGIEDLPRLELDAEIARVEAERLEDRDQLRLGDDARAAAGQLALDPLEHVHVPATLAQHQAGQQAAHRATDHQRAPPHPSTATPILIPFT